jgi:thiol-disulfide isomerase/thioredoxin
MRASVARTPQQLTEEAGEHRLQEMSQVRIAPVVCLATGLFLAGCADNQPTKPAGAVGGLGSTNASSEGQALEEAATAPTPAIHVKLLDFDGIQQLIASHKGKVVVMDCWSTSCDPCVKEFPNLVALHKKHGADKVACISLSFDYEGLGKPEDVVPVVEKFLKEQGATFDNIVCREDSDTLCKKLNLASVPAVYVYKATGELAKRFDNENASKPEDAFNYEHVAKLVDELLQ